MPTAANPLPRNLRHLRLFVSVIDHASLTNAAAACRVTQPAATQALTKLERSIGHALFDRGKHGVFPTKRGAVLGARLRRVFEILDPALHDISARLRLTTSHAQLNALIALHDAGNFTLAAARIGVAQPTLHRAIAQMESEAARPLFTRTPRGVTPTRQCHSLTQAARLAFYELDQAEADLAEFDGRDHGRIIIGAMPLSRSALLPRALVAFQALRPAHRVQILDGAYDDLLQGLRRGDIDFLIGALRDPAPTGDIDQIRIFDDPLVLLAGNHHPMAQHPNPQLQDLAAYPWVVPRQGTPNRDQFEKLFAVAGIPLPSSILDSGSILLMREMLDISPYLACISRQQAEAEISKGLLTALNVPMAATSRPIGLTLRRNWQPTAAQRQLLDRLVLDANPPNSPPVMA